MPLYEYECRKCGHRFEMIQKFSDPIVDTCPTCGGPVNKLMSSPAFHLKGTGWYATDYGKKESGVGGQSDSGSEQSTSDSGEKSSGKADGDSKASTTDAKSETKSDVKTETQSKSTSKAKSESKSDNKPSTN